MQDFQKRVVDEQSDLSGKIERLSAFLVNGSLAKVPQEEQIRLGKQLAHMQDYNDVLLQRIAAF